MQGLWQTLLNPVSSAAGLPISAESMIRARMGAPMPSLGNGVQAAVPPSDPMSMPATQPTSPAEAAAIAKIKSAEPGSSLPMQTPIPQKAISAEEKDYEKKIREFMKNREAIIKNGEDRARILRQSQGFKGMDLSPLAALVDSETGSNLQQGYQRPLTPEQRDQMARQYDQEAQQGYGALANNELQMAQLKAQEEARRQDTALKNKLLGLGGYKPQDIQRMRQDLAKSEDGKKVRAMSELKSLLSSYRPLIKEFGSQMTGEQRAKIDSLNSKIKIAYKEAAKLGALTGPDMSIIEEGFIPMTGFKGTLSEIKQLGGAKDAALTQIDSQLAAMDSDFERLQGLIDSTYPDQVKDAKETLFKTYRESYKDQPGKKKETKNVDISGFDPDAFLASGA